ncbi:MAG: T9SS type A sorting domain-containing protein [Bacteroidales bacterium]|nr:T9SS type A sorting domain-containing protein [Bacteroidales bacterium]
MKAVLYHKKITFYFLIMFSLNLSGQVYFSEGFESGLRPPGWSEQIVTPPAISWRYRDGGYNLGADRFPSHAHSGVYNALFQVEQVGPKTKLITKAIDLSEAKKPELVFWHAQDEFGVTEFDKLRVYYKVHSDSAWVLLQEYLEYTPNWTQRSIFLPENAFTSTFYLAFEGESNWGFGVCIDDIEIIERGIIPMQLGYSNFVQPSIHFVPTESKDNHVLRIDLDVYGNYGKLIFDSISIQSLCENNSDISEQGVKLYYTESQNFSSNQQLGSAQDIGSGIVNFSNLNFEIPYGNSYLWVTFNIDSLAEHGRFVDALIPPNGINAYVDTSGMSYSSIFYPEDDSLVYIVDGDTSKAPINYQFPQVQASPAGVRYIEQSILFDDFESMKGWTTTGDFQINVPMGYGAIEGGNPDPSEAYSGNNVLGNDLTGLGITQGDYENSVPDTMYARSPDIDGYYFKNINLSFYRWLNSESFDKASIRMSLDNGATWTAVYVPTSNVSENYWNRINYNLSALGADRKSNILIRYNLGPTDGSTRKSGWNVDNFAITGDFISKDVGVTQILNMNSGCGHTTSDSVTVIVKNFGGAPIDSIPVSYSFYGGDSLVFDTIYQSIPVADSIEFTFSKRINLSKGDIYNIVVTTQLAEDEDNSNNQFNKTIIVQPTIIPEYAENFESKQGLWLIDPNPNSTWAWGTPGNGITPTSGSKVWITKLIGNYKNNDSSFIESVCYDLRNENRYILEMNYWMLTEASKDGAAIQYSKDQGDSWQLLDTNEFGWDWGWYKDSVNALQTNGWSGNSNDWKMVRQLLPASLKSFSDVKFRVVFASDSDNVNIGFAIDDFKVYPAPVDVGIQSIDSIQSSECQFTSPDKFYVTMKNFGLNTLKVGDTIIAGLDIDIHSQHFADTFAVPVDIEPEQTFTYQYNQPADLTDTVIYTIRAFTLIESDPWFYFSNNDTASFSLKVMPNPLTELLDTIQTQEPDTVVLRAHYNPNYEYLWDGNILTDTFDVSIAGVYHLTVTDVGGNGCQSIDSTYVELLFNDLGVENLISPISSCGLSDEEYIRVRIMNYGTDSVKAGEEVVVVYELNEGLPVLDTFNLESTLFAYHSMDYTFKKGAIDMSSADIYKFKIYTAFGGDTVYSNDTILKNVEIYGYPIINIGSDVSAMALSYTLDAGAGYEHYQWNESLTDTLQTFEVTEAGDYSVIVWDGNNCEAYDTAYVWLKIRDIRPQALISPVSDCEFNEGVPVEMQIMNNGTDTITVSDPVYVRYKINENVIVEETITLASNLMPNATISHTFSTSEDFSISGDYNFKLIAVTPGDLRVSNDTMLETVYVYPRPVVDFGLDDIEEIYALEYTLNAGYNENYSYLWQDGPGDYTFIATVPKYHWVKVTDDLTGCTDSDSVFLNFIIHDVGVTSIDMENELCMGTYNTIEVEIENLGNASIGSGQGIQIKYKVNDQSVTTDNVTLLSTLNPNATISHVLDQPVTFTTPGENNFIVYSVFSGDLRVSNDTMSESVLIHPNPVVDFGATNDTLKVTLPYTLNPGSGFENYTWQDATTSPTHAVTTQGVYAVTVTDENGCQGNNSVFVELVSYIRGYAADLYKIEIYPVPATDYLYYSITTEKYNTSLTIVLTDINGRVVKNTQIDYIQGVYKDNIDLTGLSKGFYFIRFFNNEVEHMSKIIIQ